MTRTNPSLQKYIIVFDILCIYIFVHGHWQLTLPTCQ